MVLHTACKITARLRKPRTWLCTLAALVAAGGVQAGDAPDATVLSAGDLIRGRIHFYLSRRPLFTPSATNTRGILWIRRRNEKAIVVLGLVGVYGI